MPAGRPMMLPGLPCGSCQPHPPRWPRAPPLGGRLPPELAAISGESASGLARAIADGQVDHAADTDHLPTAKNTCCPSLRGMDVRAVPPKWTRHLPARCTANLMHGRDCTVSWPGWRPSVAGPGRLCGGPDHRHFAGNSRASDLRPPRFCDFLLLGSTGTADLRVMLRAGVTVRWHLPASVERAPEYGERSVAITRLRSPQKVQLAAQPPRRNMAVERLDGYFRGDRSCDMVCKLSSLTFRHMHCAYN